jgi:hypothetical protein
MVWIFRMGKDGRGPRIALGLVCLLFLGLALFIDLPAIHQGFLFGDQATYYAMAQSIVHDGDIEYTKKDLIRYYEDFNAGPMGVFLKRSRTGGAERLFYAKNFAYPLFIAPFVGVFRSNGPLVFHAILLGLLLLMGFAYFAPFNPPGRSLLRLLTFLFASVAGAYALWIAPDFFNLSLVFTVLFLWLYKVRAAEIPPGPGGERRPSPLRRFLLSPASDYAGAVIAGIAVYSKPPNVAVLGPILVWWIVRRKFTRAAVIVVVFVLSYTALSGTTYLMTSEWNFQGGERKSFYNQFPYEKESVTFDSAPGQVMTSEGYVERFLLPAKFVPVNVFYYFFGRYMGIAWYFFPAVLFLIVFVIGKKSFDRWLLLAAIAGEILIYVVMMPDNFGGGGGSLANRYFLCIYPFFLFLAPSSIKRREPITAWAAAAILIGPILAAPLQYSARPSLNSKRFPFTLLPVEKTNINNLPTNTHPPAMRQQWRNPDTGEFYQDRFLYFLNDNYHPKHPTENGWWTLGDRKADLILRTFFPAREIVFHLLNNPRLDNEIAVTVEGTTRRIRLGPSQRGELRFPVGDGYQILSSHQYRIKARAAKGSTPYFEQSGSLERRWLGVFFELEVAAR